MEPMSVGLRPHLPSPAQSRTKVAHKTLKPQWNEELHVLVQEPTTQLLRVEMFDHDTFNVKVGLTRGIVEVNDPRCGMNLAPSAQI